MDDLNLLITIIGAVSAIIGITAIFLMPLEHIKVYAAALGISAAIASSLLPVYTNDLEGKKINCGSVLNPQQIPEDPVASPSAGAAGLEGSELADISRSFFTQKCTEERSEKMYSALFIGILSLLIFIENVVKVRKRISEKNG